MTKPFVLIAAIVAVVGLGAAVAVAKETAEVKTSVTLEFRWDAPRAPAFLGSVKARNGCQKGRRVIVTRDNERAYAGRSNNRGKYKIRVPLRETYWAGGRYRAVANGRTITKNNGDKIVCKSDTSKLIIFNCDGDEVVCESGTSKLIHKPVKTPRITTDNDPL